MRDGGGLQLRGGLRTRGHDLCAATTVLAMGVVGGWVQRGKACCLVGCVPSALVGRSMFVRFRVHISTVLVQYSERILVSGLMIVCVCRPQCERGIIQGSDWEQGHGQPEW